MMRRAFSRRAVAVAPARGARAVHTAWGGFSSPNGWFADTFGFSKQRSADLLYVPKTGRWDFSPTGQYLHSAIKDDIRRLLATDWTHGFDGWWIDQVASHEAVFDAAYNKTHVGLDLLVSKPDENKAAEERAVIHKDLMYLKSVLDCALQTEKCYTVIFDQKFVLQRHIWDPVEREKILAGCCEMFEDFKAKCPAEFKHKAVKELEWHLFGLRHYVWDSPETKAAFPRLMA
eukprot:TRINITY_DN7248_c0_g1_i1.p1 TRINITY_DN7248_c0_g1~~TRINITY_DN7248_c0_g1_i1.p1  ORF type:complete len:231 (+),score=70.10 TRINITY_DN7248_c0_g1_i1:103-795(+)